MKEPIKISLENAWLEAFFEFLADYIHTCSWKEFFDHELMFAAYRGWKNTMFGINDDEPSIQVKEFCKIVDSLCIPYLNGAYIMFRLRFLDMATIGAFAENMVDKINDPCFNKNDIKFKKK